MSKIGDMMLEHTLKNKFSTLYEELKTNRKDKIDVIFLKLDELVKAISNSNDDTMKENAKLIETNKDLTQKVSDLDTCKNENKHLKIQNKILVDQIDIFQKTLIGAATLKNEKTELAFEGLREKYAEMLSDKIDIENTVNVVDGVLKNVSKQNALLKSKLNLKGKIINENSSNEDDKQVVNDVKIVK